LQPQLKLNGGGGGGIANIMVVRRG
jgi:hypothetical protein